MTKIGIVISMYDEIDIVKNTINDLKSLNCRFIVIQSDPGKNIRLDNTFCDKYELMTDIAGGKENYEKIVEKFKEGNPEPIGPIALTRNFSRGFNLSKEFVLDYIVGITGDVHISNLNGINQIILKMEKSGKVVAGTRTLGYTLYDQEGNSTRFQEKNSMDIMPQFFIAKAKAIDEGLFCNIERTNKYNTEQCLGDEINRYAIVKKKDFFDIFYSVCNYAYPRFIDGLHYNPDKISKMPPKMEGMVNKLRQKMSKKSNERLSKIFGRILGLIEK